MREHLLKIRGTSEGHPCPSGTWGSAQCAHLAPATEFRNAVFLARPSHAMPTVLNTLAVPVVTFTRFSRGTGSAAPFVVHQYPHFATVIFISSSFCAHLAVHSLHTPFYVGTLGDGCVRRQRVTAYRAANRQLGEGSATVASSAWRHLSPHAPCRSLSTGWEHNFFLTWAIYCSRNNKS